MKKLVLALGILGSLPFASEPVIAQSTQNGPYYANPSWDQQLPDATRFIVLLNWNSEAVLDREILSEPGTRTGRRADGESRS
jgi:hypothetical protein